MFLVVIFLSMMVFCFGSVHCLTTEFEYQLDAYYTAADLYVHLTPQAVPFYKDKTEWEIYQELFLSSPIPRILLLEASVNPLPILGAYTKKQAPHFYNQADLSDSTNLVQALTAGFEEPWAVSLFLGNMINFKPVKKIQYGEGRGYMGYLLSAGNFHIRNNDIIRDDWVEGEWKVKGDWIRQDTKLRWSFRVGAKWHTHQGIRDVFYLGARRSRTDFTSNGRHWLDNSGIMYKFDFSQSRFQPVQHHLVFDKKFPQKGKRLVPAMAVGILWRTGKKYSGALKLPDQKEFQLILQPNIEW